ncbi:DNA-J related domain-containing protein [Vibrio mytili]|uniref:DNA-J related domain-containing protein n=1 Tax=Vibrio mytili TaxID=50718 RepID=UPI002F422572
MEPRFDLDHVEQDSMENPLLWSILEILRKQPSSWKVHTLASELSHKGYIKQFDAQPDKDLFKRNFLIMNALYQLQETLYPESWLQVQAMDIQLMSTSKVTNKGIDFEDPLREYYLDWKNYDASADEVRRLLNEFWTTYQRFIGKNSTLSLNRAKALMLFELDKDATRTQIRKRWRKLALRWHPDRENGNAEQFRTLCEAWNLLRNEVY